MDDGVIDKDEKHAIERAHQRELASRHRGATQFAAVRTAIWMKDGLKSRAVAAKNKALRQHSRKRGLLRSDTCRFISDAFHLQRPARLKSNNAQDERAKTPLISLHEFSALSVLYASCRLLATLAFDVLHPVRVILRDSRELDGTCLTFCKDLQPPWH
jgi:hypothetical protein